MSATRSHAMRISWLEPDLARRALEVLRAWHADADAYFDPGFKVPPAPPGVAIERWPKVAEHVARAERVAQTVREHGVAAARTRFHDSPHAIELATLLAAIMQTGSATLDSLCALLECAVDDLVMYGPFLQALEGLAGERDEHERALAAYERFCASAVAVTDAEPMWLDWARSTRDGLAAWYVRCGRLDQADEIFLARHADQSRELIVALGASRVFLAARHLEYAARWLGRAAERAERLGRPDMARRLRDKEARVLERGS